MKCLIVGIIVFVVVWEIFIHPLLKRTNNRGGEK